MYEAIYNLKHNRKKGFTLVELVVVLVILAILLAILVPSMTGWIKKAKENQILVNARAGYLAVQTLVSEDYGKTSNYKYIAVESGKITLQATNTLPADAIKLAGVDSASTISGITISTDGKVTGMTYTEGTKTATLSDGTWTVA